MHTEVSSQNTFFCLDLTHCQHATPITHKSECYQCRDCERHATLSQCTWTSPYQALYNLVDSTASGNSRAGTVPPSGPSLICGGCRGQVQAAVVQWAPESYVVSVDFWPLRRRVQQMRRRSLSAAEGWPEWVISPHQHIWGLLPAAAPAPCICPHLSAQLWVSGIDLFCQTLSQNNCSVLLTGKAQ